MSHILTELVAEIVDDIRQEPVLPRSDAAIRQIIDEYWRWKMNDVHVIFKRFLLRKGAHDVDLMPFACEALHYCFVK